MKTAPKVFASGDLVFAKVRGYPAWPARVTSPADKNGTKFHVFFYGTYETAICKKEELWIYDASTRAKFGRQKRKMFPEALDEIENRPEIAEAALGNFRYDLNTGHSITELIELRTSTGIIIE